MAYGRDWSNASVEGSIALSACIRSTSADGAACKIVLSADASSVSINCGTTSATLANGLNGQNGLTGMNGSNGQRGGVGESCSVADNGNGSATLTCPDGTSAVLGAPKAAGCHSSGGEGLELAAAAFFMVVLRRRRVKSADAS